MNYDASVELSWTQIKLYDKLMTMILFESCLANETATITSVQSSPTRRIRPVPLSTIELQKSCSRHLHISSEQVMKIAEALYQRGVISYPRTETEVFREGMELESIVSDLSSIYPYAGRLLVVSETNVNRFQWPRSGPQVTSTNSSN